MSKERDAQVKQLLAVVEEKEAAVKAASKKPSWRTNAAFKFEDTSAKRMLNLNTASSEDQLVSALAYLIEKEKAYNQARTELGLEPKSFEWLGFPAEDWREDFKSRLAKINLDQEKAKLAKAKKQLEALKSEDAKADDALASLAALLK